MEPAPTQTDFYKGIFLTAALQTLNGFTFANLTQSATPIVNGVPLTDFYPQLKTLAEQFATAMIPQPQP